jgi:hypothetical protein
LREKGAKDRVPARNDVYCTILGYLADKPPRKCRLYLTAEKVQILGQDEVARKLRDEYGRDEVAFVDNIINEIMNAGRGSNDEGQSGRILFSESDDQVYTE